MSAGSHGKVLEVEARKNIICVSDSKWPFWAVEGMPAYTIAFLNLYL